MFVKKMRSLLLCGLMAASTMATAAGLTKDFNNYQNIHLDFVGTRFHYHKGGSSWMGPTPLGVLLGYQQGISVTKKIPIFVELGANIAVTHEKGWDGGDVKHTFLNAAVPLGASYRFSFNNGISLLPSFGTSYKFNFYARSKYENEDGTSYKIKWIRKEPEGHNARVFEFGLYVGATFNYKMLHVHYIVQPDVSSFIKEDYKVKTVTQQLGVGVNF